MRADARAEVDGRQAEVDAARAHSRDQAKQLSEMFAMLQVRVKAGTGQQPIFARRWPVSRQPVRKAVAQRGGVINKSSGLVWGSMCRVVGG